MKQVAVSISGKIFRGTVFVSTASILARIGTFLGNLIVIRLLGVELTGQLGLIEAWLTLVTVLALFGLGVATTKYIAHYLETDAKRVGAMAGTALLLSTVSSVLVGIGLFLFLQSDLWTMASRGAGVLGTTQSILVVYAPALAGLVVVLTIKNIVAGIVYGLHEFRALVNVNLVIGLVSLPVLFVFVQQRSLAGALEARFILTVVECVLLLGPVRQIFRRAGIRLSLRGWRVNTRVLTSFGLPTFVGQMIANPVQPLMLSLLAAQPGGLTQVGLITVATRLPSLANFVPSSMASTLIPVLSTEWGREDRAGFRASVFAAIRMMWLSALPILLFFMAASQTIITWLYGAEFATAWLPAFILLIIALLTAINEGADRSLAAAGRQWLSTANNVVWTVLFLLTALYFVPKWLAPGYAFSYLTSFAIYVVVQLWWLRKLFQVSLAPLRALLLVSGMLISGAWLIANWTPGIAQVIGASTLTLVSMVMVWHKLLSVSEKQALQRRWEQGRTSFRTRLQHALSAHRQA